MAFIPTDAFITDTYYTNTITSNKLFLSDVSVEALRLPDADAERINIPATPKHYWRYRMHLNIEDLAADKRFVQSITEMISQSGRV